MAELPEPRRPEDWEKETPQESLGGGIDSDPWGAIRTRTEQAASSASTRPEAVRLSGSTILDAVGVEKTACVNAGDGRGTEDDFLRDIGVLPFSDEDRPLPDETVAIEKPKSPCADCGKPIPCGAHTVESKSGKIKTIGN